jgi:transcriptional regulator with XRE-family HTH domain
MNALATAQTRPVGDILRDWRQRRRLSQLELALEAGVSSRHISFMETGRAQPSRDMLLRLAKRLDIPLRERNTLLVAGGYAPVYAERPLDDPALAEAMRAVNLVLMGHEPYPAVAIDRHWHLVAANRTIAPLLAGVAPPLLTPPVNVLRVALHPEGLAPRTVNFAQWRGHLIDRLRAQVENSADPTLADLLAELVALPAPGGEPSPEPTRSPTPAVVIPVRLRTDHGILSFFSTTTVFGTPVEVTIAELAIESFFPANQATVEALRRIAETAFE